MSDLKRATLGETLPWADDHFAAFFSTGVFTEGHAPASSLGELCRITRRGGVAIFTVRDKIFHSGGFDSYNRGSHRNAGSGGGWSRAPRSRAFALDEPDVLVTCVMCSKCC
jgi:SAM-dependent methyltransferase